MVEAERRHRDIPARPGGAEKPGRAWEKSSQTAPGLNVCQQNRTAAASKCLRTNSFHRYKGKNNEQAGEKGRLHH